MKKSFNHKIKVYYEDTDAGGVVYYANYLKFLERARSEALSEVGLSNLKIKKDYGALIVVKSCNIDFNKSAHLEDKLRINSFITSFTKTSFTMSQSIYRNKDIIVKSKVHLVLINEKSKPIKIPENILKNLKPFLFIN
jgi:acyl-CoA thioester hydrolase